MEEEAQHERKRRIQARSALNARVGLAYGLRVGEVDGIEHGAEHARRRASEGTRIGWASASREGVGPHPRPRGLGGGCVACGHKDGCTPRHVFLGECGCTRVDWSGYLRRLEQAVEAVEKLVPRVELDASVPLARWCPCRRLVRGAREAVRQRRTGGQASEEGWCALLMVAAGLLPGSLGAESLEERARWQLEAAVARAVVELQQVMVELLHSFRMATRSAVM